VNIGHLGAIALIGWVSCLTLAFFYSRDHSWSSVRVLGLSAASAVLLILFLFNESRTREPFLPLRIFRNPTIAAAGAVTLIRAVGFYSLSIYVPLLVQGVMGGTSEGARNALIMFSLPSILGSIAAGLLLSRNLGYRIFMTTGLALFGLGLWLVSGIGVTTGQTVLIRAMTIAGSGAGIVYSTTLLAFPGTAHRRAARGTGELAAQCFSVGISLCRRRLDDKPVHAEIGR